MRKLLAVIGVAAAVTASSGVALATPASAHTASCRTAWGSTVEGSGMLSAEPITAVRAGRHACFDRLVVEVAGGDIGYRVRYVSEVRTEGEGAVLPLRGSARLALTLMHPTYDAAGHAVYRPADPSELVSTGGYRTLRQVSSGGSFEGYTTIGVGVRARLPFRTFVLAGPGAHTRLVLDVAHHW